MKPRKVYKKSIHPMKTKTKKMTVFHKKKSGKIGKQTGIKAGIKTEKHSKTIKSLNKSICAPYIEPKNLSKGSDLTTQNMNIIKSATDETCFTIEALRKIADKWNETHTNMRIEYTDTTTGKSLWNSINNVMRAKCDNEVCWVKQDFIKNTSLEKELLKNFKPLMPKKWEASPTEWLNTLDIRDVMNQYEIKYPDFEFIGPVPMDFDSKVGFGQCVINELCNIDLKSLIDKGKKKIGVVFNLDKHNQPGSHWVAMHCSVPNGEICYWDSYGMQPNPEVVILMNRLQKQADKLGYNMEIKVNNVRHQYKNSECGVYCIYFLTSLLEGKTFEEIIRNIVSDDRMNAKRGEFFAKPE